MAKKDIGYNNVSYGEMESVDLDLNKSNILDLKYVDQFFKTCDTNQEFQITNLNVKTFKLVLTGGSLATNLFKCSGKEVEIIWEGGAITDYDNSTANRLYVCIEKIEPKIILTIVLNVQST